jgi:transmembrane sensor
MASSDEIDEAMRLVRDAWTPFRARTGIESLGRKLERRGRTRRVLALTAATTALVGSAAMVTLWALPQATWRPPLAQPTAAAPARPMTFLDGTTALATRPGTELRVVEDSPTRRVIQIVRGGATFDVARVEGRLFRVQLRDVAVEVLGTVFRVEEAGDAVRVAVERGRVRVIQGGRRRELGAGESAEFPGDAAASARADDVVPSAKKVAASAVARGPRTTRPAVRVAMPLARARSSRAPAVSMPVPDLQSHPSTERSTPRDHPEAVSSEAPVAGQSGGAGADGGSPDALLAAADLARRSGRPDDAVQPLRALVKRYAADARAPLAAFTLGLVQLERLRPDDAAQAFALARRLDPRGELAEDALAREVEAWHEAGWRTAAHERAIEYQRLYPRGRRTVSVRRLGGLQ